MHDMHVHTLYSSDSNENINAYIIRAREIGVETICFTEHVDNNPYDYGVGYYNDKAFFNDFNNWKMGTNDVNLLAGIEFDCPHRFQEQLLNMSHLPYDCIIGSVHYCNLSPDLFFSELVKNNVTAEDCFFAYWKEVLKCVTQGGFDVLGHMDFPKRFYKTLIYNKELLNEIFNVMISNNIILEINTSSLRKGLSKTMPELDILKLYRANGGKYVTIGSDAHIASELAADNLAARSIIKNLGLCEVIFIKRKMEII